MSPITIIGISPAKTPSEGGDSTVIDPNLLQASIGQTALTFRTDPRLGIARTLSERLELKEQIPDPEYQRGREELKEQL